MKTKTTIQLLGILLAIFILSSCAEEPIVEEPTNGELIAGTSTIGKSYYIVSAEIDLKDVDGSLVLDPCVQDNTISYYPSGRYEENEGRTKCNVEDPPGIVGEWSMSNTEAYLIINTETEREVWTIDNITENGHTITKETSLGPLTFVLAIL